MYSDSACQKSEMFVIILLLLQILFSINILVQTPIAEDLMVLSISHILFTFLITTQTFIIFYKNKLSSLTLILIIQLVLSFMLALKYCYISYYIFSQNSGCSWGFLLTFHLLIAMNLSLHWAKKEKKLFLSMTINFLFVLALRQSIYILLAIIFESQDDHLKEMNVLCHTYMYLISSVFFLKFIRDYLLNRKQSTFNKILLSIKDGKRLFYNFMFVFIIYLLYRWVIFYEFQQQSQGICAIDIDLDYYSYLQELKQMQRLHQIKQLTNPLFNYCFSMFFILITVVITIHFNKFAQFDEEMKIRQKNYELIEQMKEYQFRLREQVRKQSIKIQKLSSLIHQKQISEFQRIQKWDKQMKKRQQKKQRQRKQKQEREAAQKKRKAEKRKKEKQQEINEQCIICMIQVKTHLNTSCGHLSLCEACSKTVNDICPICRKVGRYQKVFFT